MTAKGSDRLQAIEVKLNNLAYTVPEIRSEASRILQCYQDSLSTVDLRDERAIGRLADCYEGLVSRLESSIS